MSTLFISKIIAKKESPTRYMMQFNVIGILKLFLYIFLFTTINLSSFAFTIASTKLRWSLIFSNLNSVNSISVLQPNTTYQLSLQLTTLYPNGTESPCPTCSQYLWDIGGFPSIMVKTANTFLNAYSLRDNFDAQSLVWSRPLTTPVESDIMTISIQTSPFAFGLKNFVKERSFSFPITNLVRSNSNEMILGSVQPLNALLVSTQLSYSSYFAVLNSTHFLFTLDHWKTSMIIMHNFSVTPSPPTVCSVSSSSSFEMISLSYMNTFVLLATNKGLYRVHLKTGEITYLLGECILQIKVSSYPNQCYKSALVISSTGLWTVDALGTLSEVVDQHGLNLKRYYPSLYQIISADRSSQNCTEMSALLVSNNRYSIVHFYRSLWRITFAFPITVPRYPSFSPLQAFNASTDLTPAAQGISTYESVPLVLTDLEYSKHSSSFLFVYGSCVFLSPNNGLTQYLVLKPTADAADYVTSFASSLNDLNYFFITASGKLYSGTFTELPTTLLTTLSSPPLFLDVDSDAVVYYLTASSTKPIRSDLDVASLLSTSQFLAQSVNSTCLIDSINYVGSSDSLYTRTIDLSPDFPETIYLDYGHVYEFVVEMKPISGVGLSQLDASFLLSHNQWINISYNRVENLKLNIVQYFITLQDNTLFYEQQSPDAPKASTTVLMSVQNSSNCPPAFSRSLNVYTGCPPFQSVKLVPPKKVKCVDPDPNYPCQYVDEDYFPTFLLIDQVTQTSTNFTQSYTLQILGGGTSPLSLTKFPSHQWGLLNTQTWGPANDVPQLPDGRYIYNSSTNGLFFVCVGTSPCASAFPKFPDPAQYYFITRMSTQGLSLDQTYCLFQLDYVFRLHGLNVDFITATIITLGTFAFTFLVALMLAYHRFRKTKHHILRVGIYDPLMPSTNPLKEKPIGSKLLLSEPESSTKVSSSKEKINDAPHSNGKDTSTKKEKPSSNPDGPPRSSSKPILKSQPMGLNE